jgi:cell fate (sporulation/competence/biofilm development) regulator YlbF (YheA/YmcA/DUF963 family)
MSEEVRIVKIAIKDARRIKYAEINFGAPKPGKGQLIELFADNDQGKTTLHDMCKSFFEPGKHPDLIREGCEQATAVMDLSNGVQIVRTHRADESTYDVIGANGVQIPAPASYLKKLAKGFAFDPLRFDEAEPKEQLQYLLSISDVGFTPQELVEKMGPAAELVTFQAEQLDLAGFGKFHKLVTDTRAATGRRRDEKASTVESLRKNLPSQDAGQQPRDWANELAALQRTRDQLAGFLTDDIRDISEQAREEREATSKPEAPTDAIQNMQAVAGSLLDIIRTLPINKRAAVLRATFDQLSEAIKNDEITRITAIDEKERKAIEAVTAKGASDREANAVKLQEAQDAIQANAGVNANRALANKLQAECDDLNAEYDALDKAAKDLDALRKSKVETGFVRGLEVREDGKIYIDGVYWRTQNQASRYLKAMEIVAQGVGDLGAVFVDKGESLGPGARAAFKKAVEKSGLQVLLFSVATPEQIKTYGPELQTIPPGVVPKLELVAKRRAA